MKPTLSIPFMIVGISLLSFSTFAQNAVVEIGKVGSSRCSPLVGKTYNEVTKVRIEQILDCIEKGYDPPLIIRPEGAVGRGVEIGTGSPLAHAIGKCSPTACATSQGAQAPQGSAGAWPPPPPPLLNIPILGANTSIPATACGAAVPISPTLSSLGGMGVSIPGASSGAGIMNNVFPSSNCPGSWLQVATNGANLVLPANSQVNISNGMMNVPAGSILMLPAGSTISINPAQGGSLKLPNGGIIKVNGQDYNITANSLVTVNNNGTVVLPNGQTINTSTPVVVIPGTSAGGGGSIEVPGGLSIPVQQGAQVIQPTANNTIVSTPPPPPDQSTPPDPATAGATPTP